MGRELDELKAKVTAKRKQIEAELAQLQADGLNQANDKIDALKAKLKELDDGVRGGIENATETVSKKLNDWLN